MTKTKTKANLNMRAGAGTDEPVVIVIPNGAGVTVTGDPWYPVEYGGYDGWVSGKYLDLDAAPDEPSHDYISDAMALAKSMLGLYYRWGGNFTQEVFKDKRGDCSGFVGFVSETMGYRPGSSRLYNYTADQMFDNFRNGVWKATEITPGNERAMDFVFYGGSATNAGHVVFAVGDGRVIGSSGGFEATLTDADAKRVGAMVRYDDRNFHAKPIAGIFRPAYAEGLTRRANTAHYHGASMVRTTRGNSTGTIPISNAISVARFATRSQEA